MSRYYTAATCTTNSNDKSNDMNSESRIPVIVVESHHHVLEHYHTLLRRKKELRDLLVGNHNNTNGWLLIHFDSHSDLSCPSNYIPASACYRPQDEYHIVSSEDGNNQNEQCQQQGVNTLKYDMYDNETKIDANKNDNDDETTSVDRKYNLYEMFDLSITGISEWIIPLVFACNLTNVHWIRPYYNANHADTSSDDVLRQMSAGIVHTYNVGAFDSSQNSTPTINVSSFMDLSEQAIVKVDNRKCQYYYDDDSVVSNQCLLLPKQLNLYIIETTNNDTNTSDYDTCNTTFNSNNSHMNDEDNNTFGNDDKINNIIDSNPNEMSTTSTTNTSPCNVTITADPKNYDHYALDICLDYFICCNPYFIDFDRINATNYRQQLVHVVSLSNFYYLTSTYNNEHENDDKNYEHEQRKEQMDSYHTQLIHFLQEQQTCFLVRTKGNATIRNDRTNCNNENSNDKDYVTEGSNNDDRKNNTNIIYSEKTIVLLNDLLIFYAAYINSTCNSNVNDDNNHATDTNCCHSPFKIDWAETIFGDLINTFFTTMMTTSMTNRPKNDDATTATKTTQRQQPNKEEWNSSISCYGDRLLELTIDALPNLSMPHDETIITILFPNNSNNECKNCSNDLINISKVKQLDSSIDNSTPQQSSSIGEMFIDYNTDAEDDESSSDRIFLQLKRILQKRLEHFRSYLRKNITNTRRPFLISIARSSMDGFIPTSFDHENRNKNNSNDKFCDGDRSSENIIEFIQQTVLRILHEHFYDATIRIPTEQLYPPLPTGRNDDDDDTSDDARMFNNDNKNNNYFNGNGQTTCTIPNEGGDSNDKTSSDNAFDCHNNNIDMPNIQDKPIAGNKVHMNNSSLNDSRRVCIDPRQVLSNDINNVEVTQEFDVHDDHINNRCHLFNLVFDYGPWEGSTFNL